VYRRARNRFLVTGGAALLLSLAVGAFVSAHVSRLERRLRNELTNNAENSLHLHRLSPASCGPGGRAAPHRARAARRGRPGLTAVQDAPRDGAPVGAGRPGRAIDEARTITDAALQSARQISRLLHPPMLDDTGLAQRSTGT